MMKLVVALRNFTNARKNGICQGWKADDLESRTAGFNLGMSHVFIYFCCVLNTSTVSALTLTLTLALSLLLH